MRESVPARSAPDTQLFRDIFTSSPIGIAVENLEGQPLFVNPAFCSFLGFSEEELRNKHCVDFSPPQDAEKDWALFQQLRAGSIDHYQLDKRYFRRDGSLVWGRLSISLLNSRPSPLVLAMVEDITDKKKAEDARLRHAIVIESSDDAIASGTLDGMIVSWNAAAQKIYGYTEAEAIGKPISMLVPPELPDEENRILETLRAGGHIEHLETIRVTKTGRRINVSLTISPIKDSSGKTVGVSGIARDITERKHAEEALRASEERRRLAQQVAGLGTFERDIRTGRVTWAEGLEALYGLPPGSVDGKTPAFFKDLVHPADMERVEHLAEHALKTGQPTKGEWRAIWPDGSVHWIAGRWQVLMDDSGEPSRVVGVNMDVTEHKQAEEALRTSEGRLRLAQQAARIGTFERNIRTGVVTSTSGLEWMYGLSPGEFEGTTLDFLESLIHPDDRERVMSLNNQALKTGQPTEGEWRVIWPDRSVHWIAGRWQVLMDDSGEPSRVVGVNMDVTEHKQAEEALFELNRMLEAKTASLQSSEERLKIFVKHVPAAVAMLDRDLRYLQVSDRWCRDNSLEASAVLGQLRDGLPEMPERWKEANRRALQGETLRSEVDRWESKGITRWSRWEVRPWRNSYGTVGGILVFAEDITERKQMEEELSDMSRKLIESQEQERARIGRELHDDINQKLALLAVELQYLQNDPSDIQIRLQELHKQMSELSNDVQALSHELHSSKLEYLGIVSGMRSWCKEFGERQNLVIDFKSDVSSAVPFAIGISLFRILQESLQNALKHSGVKNIEVKLREGGGEIHFTVSDQGRGFEVEAGLRGYGLGLTSMKERVRLLNGTFEIQSKPMSGTTIHVRVPLTEQIQQRQAV